MSTLFLDKAKGNKEKSNAGSKETQQSHQGADLLAENISIVIKAVFYQDKKEVG